MLERDIEKRVCEYARARGCEAEKFTSPNRGAVPDRIFTAPGGKVWFIEFKAPGKSPTPQQARDHERRRAMGFRVYVVDDVGVGKTVVDRELMGLVGMNPDCYFGFCSINGAVPAHVKCGAGLCFEFQRQRMKHVKCTIAGASGVGFDEVVMDLSDVVDGELSR